MPELNSPERLAAFRGRMLDTDLVAELDALCAEATRVTEAPIALVSLIMERVQFFRAGVGLPDDLATSLGTNRCESFCQFVVAEGRPFVVTDAHNDARVPQELVARYGIAAYVGAPVVVDGMVVGSLCAVDVKPRAFSETCIATLVELAHSTSAVLQRLTVQDSASSHDPADLEEEAPDLVRRMRLRLGVLEHTLESFAPDAGVLQRKLAERGFNTGTSKAKSADITKGLEAELEGLDRTRRAMSSMSEVTDELRAATRTLRGLAHKTAAHEQFLASMTRLERAMAEGAVLFRVVEAWSAGRLDTRAASRAISVLHEALAYVGDAYDAVREARRAAVLLAPLEQAG